MIGIGMPRSQSRIGIASSFPGGVPEVTDFAEKTPLYRLSSCRVTARLAGCALTMLAGAPHAARRAFSTGSALSILSATISAVAAESVQPRCPWPVL